MPPVARRTTGHPPSGNGASSFHLYWPAPPAGRGPATSVCATLEVLTPPSTPDLFFWALQASFQPADGGAAPAAGAHLGLQHNPACAGARAANWGGYDVDGTILRGTPLASPAPLACGNTGGFEWEAGRRYRLEIGPRAADGWPGAVTDVESGARTELRRLDAGGEALGAVVMWSEVFAECGAPRVEARWSGMKWGFADGSEAVVEKVVVGYQKFEDGGCCNTESCLDEVGVVQRTAVKERTVQSGYTLLLVRKGGGKGAEAGGK